MQSLSLSLEFQQKAGSAYCTPAALPYLYCKTCWGANVELHYMETFVKQITMDNHCATSHPMMNHAMHKYITLCIHLYIKIYVQKKT